MLSELIDLAQPVGAVLFMTSEDRQNMTHRRQRYRRRERQLEITPDPVTTEPEVEETNIGDNEGDKREEEKEFYELLLKAVQDLSRNIEGMGQRNGNGNKGKGVQGDFHYGEGSGTSQRRATLHSNMPLIQNTPPRSTIPTFLQFGAGGQTK